jgi:hypothetical protein
MQGGKNPDSYAAPYRWLLHKTSGNSKFVNFVFPIIVHYAFGSPDPVELFYNAFERAIQSAELRELIRQQSRNINLAWLMLWEDVIEKAILPTLREMSMPAYTSGFDVISRGTLKDHPIFSEYLANMQQLGVHLRSMRKVMLAQIREAIPDKAKDEFLFERLLFDLPFHDSDPWIVFALPGQPEYRAMLGQNLPPPQVRFENFTFHAARPISLRLREISALFTERASSNTEPKDRTYESTLNDLEIRIKRFRQAEDDS